MVWKIRWSQEAIRTLLKIDQNIGRRIVGKIEKTTKDPHRHYHRLIGHQDYKLRVGDYRILTILDPTEKIIFIEAIGHRKRIYKKTIK